MTAGPESRVKVGVFRRWRHVVRNKIDRRQSMFNIKRDWSHPMSRLWYNVEVTLSLNYFGPFCIPGRVLHVDLVASPHKICSLAIQLIPLSKPNTMGWTTCFFSFVFDAASTAFWRPSGSPVSLQVLLSSFVNYVISHEKTCHLNRDLISTRIGRRGIDSVAFTTWLWHPNSTVSALWDRGFLSIPWRKHNGHIVSSRWRSIQQQTTW